MTKISLTSQLRAGKKVKEIKWTIQQMSWVTALNFSLENLLKITFGNYKVGNLEECLKRIRNYIIDQL